MSTPTLSSRIAGFFARPLASATSFGTNIRSALARTRPVLRTMVFSLLLGATVVGATAPAYATPQQLNNAQIEAATGMDNDRAGASTAVGVRAWEGRDTGSLVAAGTAFASLEAAAPDFVALGDNHVVNPDAVFLIQRNAADNTMVFAIDSYTTGIEINAADAQAAFTEMQQSGRYIQLTDEMLINLDQLTAVSVTGDGVEISSGPVDEDFNVPAEEVERFLSALQATGEYAVSMTDGAVKLSSVAHASVKSGKLALRTSFGTERLDGMSGVAMEAVMAKLAGSDGFYRSGANDVVNLESIRSLELRNKGFMARYDGGSEMLELDRQGQRDLINASRDTGRFFQIGPKLLVNADSIGMMTVGHRHVDYHVSGDEDMARWEEGNYRQWLLQDLQDHPDFVRVHGDTYINLDSIAALQWVDTGQIRGVGKAVLTTAQGQFNIEMSRLERGSFLDKMKLDDRFVSVGDDLVHKNAFGQFWHTGERGGQRYTVGETTFADDLAMPESMDLQSEAMAERNPDIKRIGGYTVDLDAVAQMKYEDGKLRWQLGSRIFETPMSQSDAQEVMRDMANPGTSSAPAADQRQGSLSTDKETKHASAAGATGDLDDFVHFVIDNQGKTQGVKITVKGPGLPKMG